MAYGKCMGCGKVTDCVSGDSIKIFVPYIPLMVPVAPAQDGRFA